MSTIMIAGMLRTTMTLVPSIVAPTAMPTSEMTMPMAVPNFMSGDLAEESRTPRAHPRR